MTTQIIVNNFKTLTLNDKLEMFGKEIFTAKQFNLIQTVLKLKENLTGWHPAVKLKNLCEYMLVSERSIYSLVGHLKCWDFICVWKPVPFVHEGTLNLNTRKLEETLELEFVKLQLRKYLDEQEAKKVQEEETQEEDTQEEDTQEEETQRRKGMSINLKPYFDIKLGHTINYYDKATSKNYQLEVICTDESNYVYFEVSSNSRKMNLEDYKYHGVVSIQLESMKSVLEVKKKVLDKLKHD